MRELSLNEIEAFNGCDCKYGTGSCSTRSIIPSPNGGFLTCGKDGEWSHSFT